MNYYQSPQFQSFNGLRKVVFNKMSLVDGLTELFEISKELNKGNKVSNMSIKYIDTFFSQFPEMILDTVLNVNQQK